MSVSSLNESLLPPSSLFSICVNSRVGNFIFTAFTIASILLLLPLLIIILHVGHRRWWQPRSASTSHSDLITYHMAVMEVICVLGSFVCCIGIYTDILLIQNVSSKISFISSCSQMLFHIITCGERYLAVVHPITYMHLRKGSRVIIRDIIIWCVWLLGFAAIGTVAIDFNYVILIMYFGEQTFSLAFVSFCSLAVLRVLRRPGVGSGVKQRVDQSKQRAFNTIMAIMGTLLFRIVGNLVCTALYVSSQFSYNDRCVVISSSVWFGLPSSLVLPLLFLHRAGKLPCCRNNTDHHK